MGECERTDEERSHYDPQRKVEEEKVSGAPESFLDPRLKVCDYDLRLLAKFSMG